MRVLLRLYGNEEFVWKEAQYAKEDFFVDGRKVHEVNIAAVDDCDLSGYIYCVNCGERIKDEPGAFEQHCTEREKSRDCTNCEYLLISKNSDGPIRQIIINEDGTYTVNEMWNNSSLLCSRGYGRYRIDSNEALEMCKYTYCRKYGARQSNNLFERYPNAFDTVITVDALQEKKFKFDHLTDNYRNAGIEDKSFFLYDMKSRGTIKACVNHLGIVECFKVISRESEYYFHYSEKYDKLFYVDGRKYCEGCPCYVTDRKFNELYKKVKELYESAKEETNE